MKFFLPFADNDEQAESVYKSTRDFALEQIGWALTDRRIFSVSYRHEGKDFYAEVGKMHHRIGEEVIAILETRQGLLYVCSASRGVAQGQPMLVGETEIREIVDFDR